MIILVLDGLRILLTCKRSEQRFYDVHMNIPCMCISVVYIEYVCVYCNLVLIELMFIGHSHNLLIYVDVYKCMCLPCYVGACYVRICDCAVIVITATTARLSLDS